jgi:hypothetical protein
MIGRTSSVIKRAAIPLQQKRKLYFALPVIIVPAIGAFAAITFWQVYKKRQAEEEALRKGNSPQKEISGDKVKDGESSN